MLGSSCFGIIMKLILSEFNFGEASKVLLLHLIWSYAHKCNELYFASGGVSVLPQQF